MVPLESPWGPSGVTLGTIFVVFSSLFRSLPVPPTRQASPQRRSNSSAPLSLIHSLGLPLPGSSPSAPSALFYMQAQTNFLGGR